jgi:hypothetical protein
LEVQAGLCLDPSVAREGASDPLGEFLLISLHAAGPFVVRRACHFPHRNHLSLPACRLGAGFGELYKQLREFAYPPFDSRA